MTAARDPFRLTDRLEPAALEVMATRLEARGRQPGFVQPLADYLEAMAIDHRAEVLDLGCGTGIAARVIARRPGFRGRVHGIDLSPHLVAEATRLAEAEGLAERLSFAVGDVQALDRPPRSVDAVVAHTLFSHLADPAATLAEIVRVLRPGGVVGIFDGDYASLTFELEDAARSRAMDEAIVGSLVTNPRIMRQLPQRLAQAGLVLDTVLPSIIAEVGEATFWRSGIEAYARLAPGAGPLTEADTAAWQQELFGLSERGEFFGACVYYAYVARTPEP